MRLLELLSNGDFRLTEKILDHAIPRYAILSHTWGTEEVTFEDMVEDSGRNKAGYEKIKFSGKQAARDGLQYFWVDSCCIKKSSDAELSESLNSMFSWYYRAEKCYVYLSDVSTRKRKTMNEIMQNTWEQAFRKSTWFTRGWTLQELLAPSSVEFFSREDKRLGDKQSLEQQIHEITRIPISALRGSALSHFSTDQKLDWAKTRQITREEDWAYSLLGIFEISMPVMYGEGRTNAVRRLKKEIDDASKDKECLRHLYVTDPRADKIRIEDIKGGLIPDSYRWILENCDFKQWRNDQQSHLLWIKGDPGKGKTMLLCGIIDELKKSIAGTHLLSFFYCQATDSRINNATAVLRGLLYLLIDQQPSLISHIQKQYDLAGKTLFEDTNAWVALSEIFTNVLQDPSLKSTYLIIDALDECIIGLPKLLDFIIQKSSASPHVKWLVSSRNWPPIEERLDKAGSKVRLCLELNPESVSAAVSIYIRHKLHQLAQEKKYDDMARNAVLDHLFSNADNTFLWVALVYENLQKVKPWNVLARLNEFPPGLDSLYGRMMEQIDNSDDADLCKRILASIAIVYRPVMLKELTSLVDMPRNISHSLEWLAEIIGLCGSFLTIREDIVYFVHQSAKDYLTINAFATIFPYGREDTHYEIFSRSLHVMSRTLRRDIYDLYAPGYLIEQVKPPDPDPLGALYYSCIYWLDHLCDWSFDCYADQRVELQDGGIVDVFIRKKFLYWLEALSLCRSVPKGVLGMAKLEALIQVSFGTSDTIDVQFLLT
jgi:NACHT domain/Heterokaryon incompatibility protein (HET)